MQALFERFTLNITKNQALDGSHQGECYQDVKDLLSVPAIRRQLDKIPADEIRNELKEYGAWDDTELGDDLENRIRILWIGCGNVKEEYKLR